MVNFIFMIYPTKFSTKLEMEKYKYKVFAVLKPRPQYIDFAVQELKSLLLSKVNNDYNIFLPNYKDGLPEDKLLINRYFIETFPIVELQLQDISFLQEIIDRSVLTKTFVQLYSKGANLQDMLDGMNMEDFQPEIDSEETYKFTVTGVNKSIR